MAKWQRFGCLDTWLYNCKQKPYLRFPITPKYKPSRSKKVWQDISHLSMIECLKHDNLQKKGCAADICWFAMHDCLKFCLYVSLNPLDGEKRLIYFVSFLVTIKKSNISFGHFLYILLTVRSILAPFFLEESDPSFFTRPVNDSSKGR